MEKIKRTIKRKPLATIACSLLALGILLFVFLLLFQLKSASAAGRIFIWKNTIAAILERPLLGYGPGSFPYVYGQAQATYFNTEKYTKLEEYVAGSPEYAFNECLQMGIEGGILSLILFLIFVILVLRKGISTNEYGVCGALLSLFLFSLSSYPFQILSFGVSSIFLLAICVSVQEDSPFFIKKDMLNSFFLSLAVFVVSVCCTYTNYQNIGNYSDAENCFKSSIHLLPGRIYPYYLLSKLYLESGYFDRNKAIEMASIVMTKHPKVYSKAIDEMG